MLKPALFLVSITLSTGLIRKNFSTNLAVESLELNGYDYLWKLVTDCNEDLVARDITEYLLKISFIDVSAKLKRDAHDLHKRFIDRCFQQLKAVTEGSISTTVAVQQGYELETCTEESAFTRIRKRSSEEVSGSVFNDGDDRRTRTLRRLINLLERYVSVVEEAHQGKRHILPHAATFFGQPVIIKVYNFKFLRNHFATESFTSFMILWLPINYTLL